MPNIILTIIAAIGVHTNSFTTNGVTYAQRGGLGAADYVVTNINAKADKSALDAHIANANNPHRVTAEQVGAVPFINDVDNEKTAVTIGNRIPYYDNNTGLSEMIIGKASLANGRSLIASGEFSHAEGMDTTASGVSSHAEGFNTIAQGSSSHAEGFNTIAQGSSSHAEGLSSIAEAEFSHAAGVYSRTKEEDTFAFAWNGEFYGIYDTENPYTSHGIGTFNINPEGGEHGFYIGEQSLSQIISSGISTTAQTVIDDNAQTRQIVATWENFLDGSNVVFSITNYISGTYNLDAAKLTIKELRDGEYKEVYNSRDEILLHLKDFKDNDFKNATNQVIGAVNAAIENKADRNWGKYTSAGGVAPENTVYMTAPNTVFAGGLEYERVAVGEGAICVLTTKGAPVWTQGDEGIFKFQDDGGTNYFGFAKTDSYTIGANTDGFTVQGGIVTMNYNITMSGRPCVWYKADLTSNTPWEQLNLPDGSPVAGASHVVTWEQNPPAGTQVCYINVGNQPQGFFRATVEVTGEAKFMTNMPADLSGGIICTNTATGVNGVIKPIFDGTTVQWIWSEK